MTTQPNDRSITVTVTMWDGSVVKCGLDEIEASVSSVDEIGGVQSGHHEVGPVIEALDCLIAHLLPDCLGDYAIVINGHSCEVGVDWFGRRVWVPSNPDVIDERACVSDGVLPTEQYERLWRCGDLFGSRCSGDFSDDQFLWPVRAGRFLDEREGIAEAVKASHFYYFGPDGQLANRLEDASHDDWSEKSDEYGEWLWTPNPRGTLS